MDDLLKVLQYGPFLLALAGLLAKSFIKDDPKREAAVTLSLALLVLVGGTLVVNYNRQEDLIEKVGNDIIEVIGNNSRTFDEIYQELTPFRNVTFSLANQSMEYLLENGKVRTRVVNVRDNSNRRFRVVVFYR